jgi:putative transposase
LSTQTKVKRLAGGLAAMPQSLSNILVHIVFGTKNRVSHFDTEIAKELHLYLATVARNTGSDCLLVGGVTDHVHLAIRLSRTATVAKLVETLKTASTKWLKAKCPNLATFAWQCGYGAVSRSPGELQGLLRYISGQEEHHRTVSFEEEYRALLMENGIEFDERYMWD